MASWAGWPLKLSPRLRVIVACMLLLLELSGSCPDHSHGLCILCDKLNGEAESMSGSCSG